MFEDAELQKIYNDEIAQDKKEAQEMQAQQKLDDKDLMELKQKLQQAKSMPKPQDKDKMIEYLTKRLTYAQEAIGTLEVVIDHERSNRKEISQDIKNRNAILKEQIEKDGDLSKRINDELEVVLEKAVEERMQTQENLNKTAADLKKKKQRLEELKKINRELQKKSNVQDRESMNLQNKIKESEEKTVELEVEKADLDAQNQKIREAHSNAIGRREEAAGVLGHVDEARVMIDALLNSEDCARLLEDAKLDSNEAPRDAASLLTNAAGDPTKMTLEGRGSNAFGEEEQEKQPEV